MELTTAEEYWTAVDDHWEYILEIISHHIDLSHPAYDTPGDESSPMLDHCIAVELEILRKSRDTKLPRYFHAAWGWPLKHTLGVYPTGDCFVTFVPRNGFCMSSFADELSQLSHAYNRSERVSELLDDVKDRLRALARRGKVGVSWDQIRQARWNATYAMEIEMLDALKAEGLTVEMYSDPNSPTCGAINAYVGWRISEQDAKDGVT